MESNKKQQQNFTRSKSCQSSDSTARKPSSDLQNYKLGPRNNRRREQPPATRNDPQRNSKQYSLGKARISADKRPRPRAGCGNNNAVDAFYDGVVYSNAIDSVDDADSGAMYEGSATSAGLAKVEPVANGALNKKVQQQGYGNSEYAPRGKKQNLNHLLNFNYSRGDNGVASGKQRNNQGGAGAAAKKSKYNKEDFLRANFQFVIRGHPSVTASPDVLIEWHLIEQVNMQTTHEPQCPICLYPPVAAKLTRCGHAFCWPCILHYLALSDKTWRKCPICYEAIHISDLKSTIIVQQRQINVGDKITFQLMRRKKASQCIEKFSNVTIPHNTDRYPLVSSSDESKIFSKFLIANRYDIFNIMQREQHELELAEDITCPEHVFVQQALNLLKQRRDNFKELIPDIEQGEQEHKLDKVKNEGKEFDAEKYRNILGNDAAVFPKSEEISIDNSLAESVTSGKNSMDDLSVVSSPVAEISKDNAKYYYFYQADDGQNIYLHPLNVKMLQSCYGSLEYAPSVITARILQNEYHSMDEEHRRKFTCLGHLPLTCQFAVTEVDLQPPVVSGEVLCLFKDDLIFRKKERQRREREERWREKRINEINDRQMGKLFASVANINLGSSAEFPTCGFEETLPILNESSENLSRTTPSKANVTTKRQATYSAVAVVGESPKNDDHNTNYPPFSTWGKPTTSNGGEGSMRRRASNSDRESFSEATDVLDSPIQTNLGDVLAMAMSQKKQSAVGNVASNKKNKKNKKMQPLFSTGINYNGK